MGQDTVAICMCSDLLRCECAQFFCDVHALLDRGSKIGANVLPNRFAIRASTQDLRVYDAHASTIARQGGD